MSPNGWAPWDLTRLIAPRDRVHAMKRDAYGRLDVHNYPLIHRLGPTSPTTPWTVNLADESNVFWLLCFDFDGKIDGVVDAELMERAADQCDVFSRTLAELEIQHVVCQSSGTGGRHIWMALRDGATRADVAAMATVAKATFGQLDFGMLKNPATGSARPPLSPHRDGSFSTLLRGDLNVLVDPSTTNSDLAALTALLEERKPSLPAQESRPSGALSSSYAGHRDLSPAGAAHMATVNGGSDPSWTGFMCLLSAANAGWSLRDVEHAAKSAPGMEHYRTRRSDHGARRHRSAGEAQTRLERQWIKATERVALQSPLPAATTPADLADLADLDAIISTVTDLLERFRVSPGRWGRTESASNQQTILRVIAYLTLHTGKPVVAAAIRSIGPMAGLGRTTANAALTALAEAGYLERVTLSEEGNASEWRLASRVSTSPRTVRSQPLTTARPPAELFNSRSVLIAQLEAELTDQRHDLFTRRGLGHLAGKLYALLAQHPSLTVEAAARLLGVTSRHTATILSRLRHHKLVIRLGEGWARSKRDLRDKAARTIGAAGTLINRAERYRVERLVWTWWLAELATMNASPRKRSRRPHISSRPLFGASRPGELVWPRYPRGADNLAQHRIARDLVTAGHLNPESRWQYLGDAA